MARRDFTQCLLKRADRLAVPVPVDAQEPLEVYYRLLAKWNKKINLTSFPLDQIENDTLDRLFLEPLAAARHFPEDVLPWIDLGTGGGSPAIPLKIVRPQASLIMAEPKSRKVAFLREAVRVLGLRDAVVEAVRYQELPAALRGTARIITIRALRTDAALRSAVATLLQTSGRVLLFGDSLAWANSADFHEISAGTLVSDAKFALLERVPRGT